MLARVGVRAYERNRACGRGRACSRVWAWSCVFARVGVWVCSRVSAFGYVRVYGRLGMWAWSFVFARAGVFARVGVFARAGVWACSRGWAFSRVQPCSSFCGRVCVFKRVGVSTRSIFRYGRISYEFAYTNLASVYVCLPSSTRLFTTTPQISNRGPIRNPSASTGMHPLENAQIKILHEQLHAGANADTMVPAFLGIWKLVGNSIPSPMGGHGDPKLPRRWNKAEGPWGAV